MKLRDAVDRFLTEADDGAWQRSRMQRQSAAGIPPKVWPGAFGSLTHEQLLAWHEEITRELKRRQQELKYQKERAQAPTQSVLLGAVATLRLAGAATPDFWIQRNGSERTVGRPVREGTHPDWIGAWVKPEFDPEDVYQAVLAQWRAGAFRPLAHGTLALQHVKIFDVARIRLELRASKPTAD